MQKSQTLTSIKNFDAVYLINLKKRSDRLEKWLSDNKAIVKQLPNLIIIEAVDGTNLTVPPQWNNTKGALGCLESHLTVLQSIIKNNYNNALVFEDDFTFINNFESEFEKGLKILPENWDMLYLYGSDHIAATPYKYPLMKCNACLSTVAYAINHKAAKLLIPLIELKNYPIDVVYGHMHFLIQAYRFTDNICLHYDGYSDTLENYSNYHPNLSVLQKLKKKIKSIKNRI